MKNTAPVIQMKHFKKRLLYIYLFTHLSSLVFAQPVAHIQSYSGSYGTYNLRPKLIVSNATPPITIIIEKAPLHGRLEYLSNLCYDGHIITSPLKNDSLAFTLYYYPDSSFIGTDIIYWRVMDSLYSSETISCSLTIYDIRDGIASVAQNTTRKMVGFQKGTVFDTLKISRMPEHGILEYGNTSYYPDTIHTMDTSSVIPVGTSHIAYFYYTPDNGYLGPDTLTAWVYGAACTSRVAVLNITVQPNEPPVPNIRTYTPTTSTPLSNIYLSYQNRDSGVLINEISILPRHGTLTYSPSFPGGGPENYRPVPEATELPYPSIFFQYESDYKYTGPDTFFWVVHDVDLISDTGYYAFDVQPNQPPIARKKTATVPDNNGPYLIQHSSRYYSNWDYLYVTELDDGQEIYRGLRTNPEHGTILVESGGVLAAAGQDTFYPDTVAWYYTPDPGYLGPDTFYWYASDNIDPPDTTMLIIEVVPNSPPTAQTNKVMILTNDIRRRVRLNVLDADNYQDLYTIISELPDSGIFEHQYSDSTIPVIQDSILSSNLCYTPPPGYTGNQLFTWLARDASGACDTILCTLAVYPNHPPVAISEVKPVAAGSPKTKIGTSIEDPERTAFYQSIMVSVLDTPRHGNLSFTYAYTSGFPDPVINSISYLPDPNYIGLDFFKWLAYDGLDWSDTATCTLSVYNTIPVVCSGKSLVTSGDTLTIHSRFDDPDFVQTDHAAILAIPPARGTVTCAGTDMAFTADSNATGPDSFAWMINDGFENSDTAWTRLMVHRPGDGTGQTIIILFSLDLADSLAMEIQRLQSDLEHEGYKVILNAWSGPDDGEAVWEYLSSIYHQSDKFLSGAILIGRIPWATYDEAGSCSDFGYWNMETFNDLYTQHIWVSRISAHDVNGNELPAGSEVTLLRRALDANHAYRTGQSRLPHRAIATAYQEYGYEMWSEVDSVVEGQTDPATFLSSGSDLFFSQGHGSRQFFWGTGDISATSVHDQIPQSRYVVLDACLVATPGGVLNNFLFARGGGTVMAMGASEITAYNSFAVLRGDIQTSAFRRRLAAGDTWGNAFVADYPFSHTTPQIHYGDLSLPVMMAPANAVPRMDTLYADVTSGELPLTVTFTAAASDSDGSISAYEWFPEGHQGGRVEPILAGSTATSLQYTYTQPGIYKVRVAVKDDYLAYAFREITITAGDVNVDDRIMNVSVTELRTYPNPFSTGVMIPVQKKSRSTVCIYDRLGKPVTVILTDEKQGWVIWDGKDRTGRTCTPGLYFTVVTTEKTSEVIRLMKSR